MSALTQALVDVGFSPRRADAIETAVLGAAIDASNVVFTPTGSVAATDVQAAIAEVDGDVTAHVGDTIDAHDASAISILDSGNNYTATDVEAALAEVMDALQAHQADTSDAHDASAISFSPTGTIAATDVQAAIAEVASESGGGITTIASGSLSGATVSITGIPETYSYLVLQITGGSSDTANRTPLVRASTDNGSSYDATAANYLGDYWDGTTYADTTLASLMESASIGLAATTFTATITIFNYQTGPHKFVEWRYLDSGAGSATKRGRTWYTGSTNNIDALQILWSGSGSFDAGTYALYGVK